MRYHQYSTLIFFNCLFQRKLGIGIKVACRLIQKKKVRIRLFKYNSRYKGDLFVSVNGVNYKIRRGVEVEVPPEVAEVLEHSQMQDELTAARIAAAENAAQ